MIVDTETFWQKLCDPRAVREDLYNLRIAGERFTTTEPSELVHEFMKSKCLEISDLLGLGLGL